MKQRELRLPRSFALQSGRQLVIQGQLFGQNQVVCRNECFATQVLNFNKILQKIKSKCADQIQIDSIVLNLADLAMHCLNRPWRNQQCCTDCFRCKAGLQPPSARYIWKHHQRWLLSNGSCTLLHKKSRWTEKNAWCRRSHGRKRLRRKVRRWKNCQKSAGKFFRCGYLRVWLSLTWIVFPLTKCTEFEGRTQALTHWLCHLRWTRNPGRARWNILLLEQRTGSVRRTCEHSPAQVRVLPLECEAWLRSCCLEAWLPDLALFCKCTSCSSSLLMLSSHCYFEWQLVSLNLLKTRT